MGSLRNRSRQERRITRAEQADADFNRIMGESLATVRARHDRESRFCSARTDEDRRAGWTTGRRCPVCEPAS